MALSGRLLQHLRDNLNYMNGGGLHLKSDAAMLIDTPILAIGLGGTGVDSLIRLKNLINERLNVGSDKEKYTNIEYLAIDTDSRTKITQYRGTKFSEASNEICIMEDSKLARTYASLSREQLPHVNEWISENIDVAQITHGAGAVRQIGRFLFFKEFERVKIELAKKISKITQGRATAKKAYTFIVTGVSGGTGSGIFVDVPYIVRKLFNDAGFETQILGFIFLPDVNLQPLPQEDNATRRNIQRNGFAALKELDYLMNLGRGGNGERFEQEYGTGFKVSFDQSPYDICHLISSVSGSGVNQYTKENCMAVTAETIFNFIADEPNIGAENFTIASYLSNIDTTTASFVTSLGETKQPINYKYNVIGNSTGVLPMDNVLNYLTYSLFTDMQEIFTREPDKKTVMELVSLLRISTNSIEDIVTSNIRLRDIDLYGYDNIKNDPTVVERVFHECIESSLIDTMHKNVIEFMKDFESVAKKRFEAIFTDLDRGPFYLSKLLYSAEGYSLQKYITEQINTVIIPDKITEAEVGRLKGNMISLRKKLVESSPFLGFNKEGIAKEYKKSCQEYYSAVLKNFISDRMISCYEEIYAVVNDANNKVFSMHTEMLKALKDLFSKYSSLVHDNTDINPVENTFSWEIIETKQLIGEVLALLQNDSDFYVNIKSVVQSFIEELIQNAAAWLDEAKPNVAELLNEFIITNYHLIAHQSIDFYVKRITEDDHIKEQGFVNDKMKQLIRNSEVMFPVSVFGGNLNVPPYRYLSLPYNTEAFGENLEGVGTIKKSVITNRLFMLNVNIAYPLMAYRELEACEAAYESFTGKAGVGMHLYEKGAKNWANLPSPIYDSVYSPTYTNPRQKKANEDIRTLFEKAVKYGYIKYDEDKRQYYCLYATKKTTERDILNMLGVSSVSSGLTRTDALKHATQLKKYLADEARLTEKTYFYDSKFDKETSYIINEYAKGIFINMPAIKNKIYDMVTEHEMTLSIISKLDKIYSFYKIYAEFAGVLYTGILRRDRATYKYEDAKQFMKTLFTINSDCPDNYYEYYVFDEFSKMTEPERKFIYDKSQELINQDDAEKIQPYTSLMKKFNEDFGTKRKQLSEDYTIVIDGAKKADFYTEMRLEMEKAIELYCGE